MSRLLPSSLAGQTVLVLIIGLTLSHLLSMAVYSADRAETLMIATEQQVGHRVGEIARLLQRSPPEWREGIVHVVDGPSLRVWLSPGAEVPASAEPSWQERLLRAVLAGIVAPTGPDDIAVDVVDREQETEATALRQMRALMMSMMAGSPPEHSVRASVRLDDGQWVNFATSLNEAIGLWSFRSVLSTALMTGAIAVMSFWVVRRMTRPLRALASASQRLGRDVGAPALREQGPSEVVQAIAAFNEMQQRLRRLIDNRTEMLAAISHDLRTPITLLRLRAEYIADAEERRKTLATLDEMEAMIASTLAFARDDAAREERRVVDVRALVGSLCDDLADAGRPVVFRAGEPVKLACRPLALKRAIGNLIDNAVTYGGRAEVAIADLPSEVTVTVDDPGPGIPADEREAVFQPFHRLERSRSRRTGGVGLGLSVTRSVAEAHGGDVVLAERPGGGLRAAIHLPR